MQNVLPAHLKRRPTTFLNVTPSLTQFRHLTNFTTSTNTKKEYGLQSKRTLQPCLRRHECIMPLTKNTCHQQSSQVLCFCTSKCDVSLPLQPFPSLHPKDTHHLRLEKSNKLLQGCHVKACLFPWLQLLEFDGTRLYQIKIWANRINRSSCLSVQLS